jgi:hypothetical protein
MVSLPPWLMAASLPHSHWQGSKLASLKQTGPVYSVTLRPSLARPHYVHEVQLGHHIQVICMLCMLLPLPRLREQFPTFSSFRAIPTHIQVGCSSLCQREGKGVLTVTMQYRPLGRANNAEAGAIGPAWVWPVQPSAAPPGNFSIYLSYFIRLCMYKSYHSIL